ncbi:Bax inhibitor-1/YccA family protein [Poseidonocella sedimentorum]|uniref:Modulator of FtsH protease n=1 Tax=Poseidonocella sedimentorum TaxID=871652 RepID=A0A1I6CQ20_9RHOB|nr:Bax inhibitor-1/YccA family protein [Poseidonocella sedimentorum]SFQ95253.1 hypothetical protein SAMN04515673_101177 [Poseidonocella sedimentorum]
MAELNRMRTATGARSAVIDEGLRAHMNKVYGTMSVGMLITFAVAWAVGSSEALLSIFRDPMTLRPNILGYVAMFAPLGMIFAFGPVMRRASAEGARLFFFAFAAMMGLSLSYIFAAYTGISIAQTFLVTSIAFAGLSLWGYTTKRDISGWGSFLIMGVIGLLVAMVINIFLQSPAIMFVVSILGVLIFAGLTAYDTQKIKAEYVAHAHHGDQEWLEKSGIHGALNLYLDFLNMFQFLLMFMGSQE